MLIAESLIFNNNEEYFNFYVKFQVGLYEAEVAELAQRSNQQFLNLVMLT